MRYVQPIWLINLCLCLLTPALAAQTQLAACLEQGKKEFVQKNHAAAHKIFERCLSLDKTNVDTLLSLGGVCLTQDDLAGARNYFLQSLKYMKRTSPYLSYTYSMLGDIALKQAQPKAALAYYNRSLRFNEANVNSLVGKAVITEQEGDKKAAVEMYKTALAVEPLNLVARKKLIALEPLYFTDEEMLDSLKQRYAVLPDKTELSEGDREIFSKIHSAEQRGGIEYLKGKYARLPEDYTVILFKDTSLAREVLTLSGYSALQKQIGQDALNVFQKTGVRTQDLFELRDLKGQKIFLPDSTLTDSGYFVYTEALQGRKVYLLPSEAVPPSQEHLDKVAARVKELSQNGYIEISRKELAVVKQSTNCSEDTMRERMSLYVLPISKTEKRYYVQTHETTDPRKGVPYYYVALYRKQKNPSIRVPRNSIVETYNAINYKICHTDGTLLE